MFLNRIFPLILLVSLSLGLLLSSLSLAQEDQAKNQTRPTSFTSLDDQAIITKSEIYLDPDTDAEIVFRQEVATQTSFPYNSYNSGAFFLPPYPSDQERMGFGKASPHDTTSLNAGWYVDWGSKLNPPHLGGVEYAHTIYFNVKGVSRCKGATERDQVTARASNEKLIRHIRANPGALWLVGNEPDSLYNGSPIHPELYAELYHEYYTLIKQHDPTAKIAVAAVVQPSTLRMEYLDKVLDHYEASFGQALDSDLWNIHFYLLNEGPCDSAWGSAVPPDSSSDFGWSVNFSADSMLDVDRMRDNLSAFRQWMKNRGFQNKPLIITEFGVLPPPSYTGFSDARAVEFLEEITAMFLETRDTNIGYPADDHRLIQFWAWFSSDHNPAPGWFKYGGDLYQTNTEDQLTIIGEAFQNLSTQATTNYIDLLLAANTSPAEDKQQGILGLELYALNKGNITATNSSAFISIYDSAKKQPVYTEAIALGDIGPRYAQDPLLLTINQAITQPSSYTVSVTLETDRIQSDVLTSNNHYVSDLIDISFDLHLSALTLTPASQGSTLFNNRYEVTALVKNESPLTIPLSTLSLNFQGLDPVQAPDSQDHILAALPPASSQVYTYIWNAATEGLYQIQARVGLPADLCCEANLSNNEQIRVLWVGQSYDQSQALTLGTDRTNTLSMSLGISDQLTIPPQALTTTLVLAYRSLVSPTQVLPFGIFSLGKSFVLETYQDTVLKANHYFSPPLSITLAYPRQKYAKAPGQGNERLKLYHLADQVWQDAAKTCTPAGDYRFDDATNELELNLCRSGEFVLVNDSFYPLYIPFLIYYDIETTEGISP